MSLSLHPLTKSLYLPRLPRHLHLPRRLSVPKTVSVLLLTSVVFLFASFHILHHSSRSFRRLLSRAGTVVLSFSFFRPESPLAPRTLLLDANDSVVVDSASSPSVELLNGELLNRKYLFVNPRDDGFNNQRISIAEGLFCAAVTGRVAVLPYIFSNTRYGTRTGGPFLFRDYFDLNALANAAVANFTTPDVLESSGYMCGVDTSKGRPARVLAAMESFHGWMRQDVETRGRNWSYSKCMSSVVCKVDFNSDSVYGKSSNYEAWGQGYNILESENFRRFRAAVRPSIIVRAIAEVLLGAMEGPFNAVHLRRTDYSMKCKQMKSLCSKFGSYSVYSSEGYAIQKIFELSEPHLPLFIATEDPSWARKKLGPLLAKKNVTIYLAQEIELPSHLGGYRGRVDILSFATQVVASQALEFIGNRFSSFSAEIFNERVLNNINSSRRFF